MPDLSLREKIEATLFPTLVDNGRELICRDDVLAIIDEHERELVARIEERRFPTCGCSSGCRHDEVNTALDYILALIKPAVKESLTTQPTENRDTTPRDERPARDVLESLARRLAARSVEIFEEDGRESAIGCAVGIVGDEIIAMLSDTAADRIARALEDRK